MRRLQEATMWLDPIPLLMVLAAVVIYVEGMNKLHRTDPLERGLGLRARVVVLLKVLAWILLVLGSAGVFVRPFIVIPAGLNHGFGAFLASDRSSLLFVLGGFALLIVRSRFKEQSPCESS
jgi:hypothetical protein